MLKIDLRKIYNFYPVEPLPSPDALPVGGDLYYECLDCGGIVSSVPRIRAACACENLTGGAGQVVVRDATRVQVVRGKLK